MHTSMPQPPLIRVTREHIAELRTKGAPACLTWHEDTCQVEVTAARDAVDPNRMIISGARDLAQLEDLYTVEGLRASDDELAGDLSAVAAGRQPEWPGIRAMSRHVHVLRRTLADAGVYLAEPPMLAMPVLRLPAMTDYYRLEGSEQLAGVEVTFGFLARTRITITDEQAVTRPLTERTLATSEALSHAVNSRLIASTVREALSSGL
ncbi:hypothetical protein [Nocardiopsis salina]|uniref:hypothetical protein n=1 Tax=Nocardiopsis salina TaxID=245836 RepID=UPI00034BC273|nr:hypothetical protein [Nocardiopsis salina]